MRFEPFPLVEIHGAPFERGRMHGAAAQSRVRLSAQHYSAQLHAMGLTTAHVNRLVARYLPIIEGFDDKYVEEMRGIAAGAAVSFEQIVLINARTEILQLARAEARIASSTAEDPDGCTGLALLPEATANARVLHALNWDWKLECAETAIVLRILRDDGPDLLMLAEAGSLARAGLNSRGLAVTANYLESDRDHWQPGIPVALIRRRLLECEHVAQAIHVLCSTVRSSSNNLLISHADGFAIDFECAPDEMFALYPQAGLLVHANHWISPVALGKLRDTGVANTPESYYRDWRVRAALQPHLGQVTEDHVRTALSDRFGYPWSVCRPPRQSLFGNLSATVATLVMDPAQGTLEITPMPAENSERTRYQLTPDRGVRQSARA